MEEDEQKVLGKEGFEKAVAQVAVDAPKLASALKKRLELYRQGRPYREIREVRPPERTAAKQR